MQLLDGRTITIRPADSDRIKNLVEYQIKMAIEHAATDPEPALLTLVKALAPHVEGLNETAIRTHLLKYPDDARRIAGEILGREIPIITWQKVD